MSKIISVSDEIYDRLKSLKEEKSYTLVIKDLLLKKNNKEEILKFVGKGGIDGKKIKAIKKEWKNWSKKYA